MSRSGHLTGTFSRLGPRIQAFTVWERGVTGLETAIILIAFVVVASVFAFTVLSTGTFSSQKGDETVHAGLKQARGGIRLQGSIIANGVVDTELSDADAAWTDLANVTATTDTTDKKEGASSGELTVDSAKTGLLAYENISPSVNLGSYDSIRIWIKSSIATTAGQITLVIDDTTGCSSPSTNGERINLPALAANTWKNAVVGITASTTRSAVGCVGLYMETALGSQGTVNFDDVVAQGQATNLVIIIANTVEGVAIDMATPSDADNDGMTDSEDKAHNVLVSYTDENQKKNDVYWTNTYIGVNDGDDLLEEGERAQMTISLLGLDQATPLIRDTEFAIEIKPAGGSDLIIQRTTPSKIDSVMNLQ